jgi:hypothetical protein
MTPLLYLHYDEPHVVTPDPRNGPAVTPGPSPSLRKLVAAIEELWPPTTQRIAEYCGITYPDAVDLIDRGVAAGLVYRRGRTFYATEAGVHLLMTPARTGAP